MKRDELIWVAGSFIVLLVCIVVSSLTNRAETPVGVLGASSDPAGLAQSSNTRGGRGGPVVAPVGESDGLGPAADPAPSRPPPLRIRAMSEELDLYAVELPADRRVQVGEEVEAVNDDGLTLWLVVDEVKSSLALCHRSDRNRPLPPFRVPPPAAAPAPIAVGAPTPPLSGKVVGVDNPRGLFVILAGRMQGVQPGAEFTVRRADGTYVNTVIVQEVLHRCSHVRSKPGTTRLPTKMGDRFSNQP